MKLSESIGSGATFMAFIGNIGNWLFDGNFNLILTLILTCISIPYMVFRLINERSIYLANKRKQK